MEGVDLRSSTSTIICVGPDSIRRLRGTLVSREIPWLRIGVEGVVIVGSILLAFGIDAWRDESAQRRMNA